MASVYGTREGFLKVYESLKDEIIAEIRDVFKMPTEAVDWQKNLMEYNVPGGKLNRGLTVVHVLQAIKGDSLTEEDAKKAAVLGWCIEWLQAFFLVADDIMDGSVTRRGSPCWFRLPHVGMIAINDGFLLQAHLYRVLRKHFAGSTHYLQLIELFNQTTWETELGQLLDLTSQPLPGAGQIDLDRFTIERYKLIVKYKTAFYSFVLPVACGLVLGGLGAAADKQDVKDILLLMGEYFQVQDDYLDCYADPSVLGKVGTDVQDNKCSWLVVQALNKASEEQRAFLKANYGQHDEGKVVAVKDLYKKMDLEKLYLEYEESSYKQLNEMIATTCKETGIPESVFGSLLAKIYKRAK